MAAKKDYPNRMTLDLSDDLREAIRLRTRRDQQKAEAAVVRSILAKELRVEIAQAEAARLARTASNKTA